MAINAGLWPRGGLVAVALGLRGNAGFEDATWRLYAKKDYSRAPKKENFGLQRK